MIVFKFFVILLLLALCVEIAGAEVNVENVLFFIIFLLLIDTAIEYATREAFDYEKIREIVREEVRREKDG